MGRKLENCRKCDVCKIDVHRASFANCMRSEKYSEKKRQDVIIIPECLFKEEQKHIKNKIRNIYHPKPLKQTARGKFIINDKDLAKESS